MFRRFSYYLLYVPTLIMLTTYLCTLGPLTPFRRRMEVATLWGEFVGRFWLRWTAGIHIKIEGMENVPEYGNYLIVSNHQSEWETLFIPRLLRPAIIVLKKSLTRIPIYGWAMLGADPIAIERASPKESIKQILTQGVQRLHEGHNVLLFPESTRVAPGTINKYTRTGAKLAIEADIPIIPLVHNSGDCWSPKRWFRPGQITLRIGKPIEPTGKTPAALTEEVEHWTRANYPGEFSTVEAQPPASSATAS